MAHIQHLHRHNSGRVTVVTELYFDFRPTVAATQGFEKQNKIDEIGSEIPKPLFRPAKTDVRGAPEKNISFWGCSITIWPDRKQFLVTK